MDESFLIYGFTGIVILLIFLPYALKFFRQQKEDNKRMEEATMLGADKAIAQHPQINDLLCIGCGSCVAACPEEDVLGIVSGRAAIINGLKCVGHGMCEEACPVGAISIGLGDVSKRDDIPLLTKEFETNIPGLFIAGELGGLALIRNAINQGSKIADIISEKVKKREGVHDLLVIGAGPAGMSASLRAMEKGLNVVTIDQQDTGGTILQYPRKKLVMTRPVHIPLYGTLTKQEYSKEELLDIWQSVIKKHPLTMHLKEKFTMLERENGQFNIHTDKGQYKAQYVVLALGRRGTPRKLKVPGEEQSKVMYKLMDADSYRNNHVLVVGGGDSAIEAAIGLARQPGNNVTISYRKNAFFRIKNRNQKRLDEMLVAKKLKVLFNSNIKEISTKDVTIQTEKGTGKLPNDYVFIFAGGEPPFELLKKIGVQFGAAHSLN